MVWFVEFDYTVHNIAVLSAKYALSKNCSFFLLLTENCNYFKDNTTWKKRQTQKHQEEKPCETHKTINDPKLSFFLFPLFFTQLALVTVIHSWLLVKSVHQHISVHLLKHGTFFTLKKSSGTLPTKIYIFKNDTI